MLPVVIHLCFIGLLKNWWFLFSKFYKKKLFASSLSCCSVFIVILMGINRRHFVFELCIVTRQQHVKSYKKINFFSPSLLFHRPQALQFFRPNAFCVRDSSACVMIKSTAVAVALQSHSRSLPHDWADIPWLVIDLLFPVILHNRFRMVRYGYFNCITL